jgi:hypothetical protein
MPIFAPTPIFPTQFSLANYGFAGLVPGRSAFYLPDTTKPSSGVGQVRNLTLDQPPLSEVGFLTGDGKRKLQPLVLTGYYIGTSEEDMRLWGASLEESLPQWTGIQRSADTTRVLLPGAWVEWPMADRPYIRPFTLTLLPSGPNWTDGTGLNVPF